MIPCSGIWIHWFPKPLKSNLGCRFELPVSFVAVCGPRAHNGLRHDGTYCHNWNGDTNVWGSEFRREFMGDAHQWAYRTRGLAQESIRRWCMASSSSRTEGCCKFCRLQLYLPFSLSNTDSHKVGIFPRGKSSYLRRALLLHYGKRSSRYGSYAEEIT